VVVGSLLVVPAVPLLPPCKDVMDRTIIAYDWALILRAIVREAAMSESVAITGEKSHYREIIALSLRSVTCGESCYTRDYIHANVCLYLCIQLRLMYVKHLYF